MKMEEIKREFPDEWVLVEVTESDENDETLEGKLLYHHPNKRKVIEEMGQFMRGPGKPVSIEYTGEIPEDAAFMF